MSLLGFMTSAQFWFESMQNWQSEFLAVFALVVLGVFLRERGSPESKPVAAAHAETGSPNLTAQVTRPSLAMVARYAHMRTCRPA